MADPGTGENPHETSNGQATVVGQDEAQNTTVGPPPDPNENNYVEYYDNQIMPIDIRSLGLIVRLQEPFDGNNWDHWQGQIT